MPFLEDTHFRINQTNAQVGIPVVLPEDWDEIDEMTFDMTTLGGFELSEFDSNAKGQAQAAELLKNAIRADVDPWTGKPQSLQGLWDRDYTDVALDTRWCPDYDESDSRTTHLRALVYDREADSFVWVPLSDPSVRDVSEQLDEIADAYHSPRQTCQAHNVPECDYFKDTASNGVVSTRESILGAFTVKRGETLVIFYCCPLCRERMNQSSWQTSDYVGRGAMPWYDELPDWCPDYSNGSQWVDPNNPWGD